jgi:hypothetical protein
MTIFVLDADLQKAAQYLDDKQLNKQIKEIAQVLCNVHWMIRVPCPVCDVGDAEDGCTCLPINNLEGKPLAPKLNNFEWDEWSQWARECIANYKWLVEFGWRCLEEYWYRHISPNLTVLIDEKTRTFINRWEKYRQIILWSKINKPDLLECAEITLLPVDVPEKYKFVGQVMKYEYYVIHSYRDYYIAKLKKSKTWTKRKWPDFLCDKRKIKYY